jgi:hypothetical protein
MQTVNFRLSTVGTMWPNVSKAALPLVRQNVLFQGVPPSLQTAVKAIDRNLDVIEASPSNRSGVLKLLREFYLGEVDPASAHDKDYERQGSKIYNVHEAVIDANLLKAMQDPNSAFYAVTNSQTGDVVATAALLQSALNGSHQPPANCGQMSYFYKAKNVPDTVSLALVNEIANKAKALNLSSLFTTARRKGMDDRNALMRSAGFKEVTTAQRISELVPPLLRGPRTVVYEKPLR